ncbi:MAG: helical backbone metal receptor [Halanaeroarchaeum sp.]
MTSADDPRVVSLAPSATNTLVAMGATESIVGATDHSPVEAESVGRWLNPSVEAIAALSPDVVFTTDALQEGVVSRLDAVDVDVVHLDPRTVEAVLASFETIGEAVGRPQQAAALEAACRDRIEAVRTRVPWSDGERPIVYCEEWDTPPMAAGNWVPEAVRIAGGEYPFVEPGERSEEISRAAVEAADPDHVILHYCGRGADVDPRAFTDREWTVEATVTVFEDAWLNQPSPTLVDGIERLAAVLHSDHTDRDG